MKPFVLKKGRLFIVFLCACGLAYAQAPVITSGTPAVNQGQTFQFTATGGGIAWSCVRNGGACLGNVTSGGLYTAPATVTPQNQFGGCQLFSNDQIYNARIDSLPVDANSTTMITNANFGSLNYGGVGPWNFVQPSTPTTNMTFQFTPLNNGPFTFVLPPTGVAQSGWYGTASGSYFNIDHHTWTINPPGGTPQGSTACQVTEVYQYFPATFSCGGTCNAVTGIKYLGTDWTLPANGGTDGAGTHFSALELHGQELVNAVTNSTTIQHALHLTWRPSSIRSVTFRWPATTGDFSGGPNTSSFAPYGARIRLKSAFDISSFSAIAKVILTQAKQYGFILGDNGTDWDASVDGSGYFPFAYNAAFTEIANAAIAPTNFEVVDESSLMVSSSSGVTTTSEHVCATNGSGSACQDVILLGVTIGLPNDHLWIQAGVSAQQFTAYVGGTSNTGVTWTMSPTVGTLTAGGLYTPPATVTNSTATTITATSNVSAAAVAQMTVTILPNGTMRFRLGGTCQSGLTPSWTQLGGACISTPYVDAEGNSWQGTLETGSDNCGGTWTFPDFQLYAVPSATFGGDAIFNLIVPNGTYNITGKFAVGPCSYNNTAAAQISKFEVQGVTYNSSLDIFAAVGNFAPYDFSAYDVPVTNGQLSFVLRKVVGIVGPTISSLQIQPLAKPTTTRSQGWIARK